MSHNDLPPYFDIYRNQLEKITTPYSLRSHMLPVPQIAHVFAESCLIYQLVQMKNKITKNDELILIKINERSHSHSGFNIYVKNSMINKYKYECNMIPCHTCERT